MPISRVKTVEFPYHTPLEFGVDASDASVTLVSGEAMTPRTSYTTTNITGSLTVVADITDPSSWTTVWTVNGPCYVQLISLEGDDVGVGFTVVVDSGEDANDAIRMKLSLDGVTVFDMYSIRNAGSDQVAHASPFVLSENRNDAYSFSSVSIPIRVKNSMVLYGACRDGGTNGFAQAESVFSAPAVLINTY